MLPLEQRQTLGVSESPGRQTNVETELEKRKLTEKWFRSSTLSSSILPYSLVALYCGVAKDVNSRFIYPHSRACMVLKVYATKYITYAMYAKCARGFIRYKRYQLLFIGFTYEFLSLVPQELILVTAPKFARGLVRYKG